MIYDRVSFYYSQYCNRFDGHTGVVSFEGQGAFLIAGYNVMKKEERARYDEKALCRFVGWVLIALSFAMLLFPAGIYFDAIWLSYCGVAIFVVGISGAAVYANTGNRFRNIDNGDMPIDHKKDNSHSKHFKVLALFVGIVFIAIGVLLYLGAKDPVVAILDNSIQIKAMYGLSIDCSEIADISLIENNMSGLGIGNSNRVNGYGGIGKALKGHFKSDSLGEALLFVQANSSPLIRIKRHNKEDVYLNFRDSEKTERVYYEMIANGIPR
ncbi:MAG: DUF3784 domain-containing protein [Peptococcaceae bacterium]|nr:DUF3784 domain-containing protein [Peptococcaceae bacterium]